MNNDDIPDFNGTHLFDRLCWAQTNLEPYRSELCCVFEDPVEPDAPVKIMSPAPEWMACALAGGILPPIEAYHEMPLELEMEDGSLINTTYLEAQEIRASGAKVKGEKVLPHHTLHTSKPIEAMTEEQAFEYLIMKDVPKRVWGKPHNRPMFYIININQLPQDRKNRNQWKLADLTLAA